VLSTISLPETTLDIVRDTGVQRMVLAFEEINKPRLGHPSTPV